MSFTKIPKTYKRGQQPAGCTGNIRVGCIAGALTFNGSVGCVCKRVEFIIRPKRLPSRQLLLALAVEFSETRKRRISRNQDGVWE